MFPRNFCLFPTQNFVKFQFPRFCPSFSPFFFLTRFFILFFLAIFFSKQKTSLHPTSIFPPPLQITSSHLATANHCRRRPTDLQSLPSLATTHCHQHSHRSHHRPPLPPTATTILFSLFFGVQVSLKCKSLCFSLWVCFDLVFSLMGHGTFVLIFVVCLNFGTENSKSINNEPVKCQM